MTVSTTPYFSWSESGINSNVAPYNTCSPNLVQIQAYCNRTFGGVRSLGCHVPPPSSTKSHPYGAANDLRFNGGRTPTLKAINELLIPYSAELGVNTIHDYFDNQRMWKPLVGWIYNAPIGSPDGTWIHVETTPAAFLDGRPVEDRLTGTIEQLPGDEFMTPDDQKYLDLKFAMVPEQVWARQFGAEYPPLANRPAKDWELDIYGKATRTEDTVAELLKLVKALALAAGDPEAIAAQVTAIVREEIDKTLWQSRPLS